MLARTIGACPMRLGEGNWHREVRSRVTVAIERWKHRNPPCILSHNKDCCIVAYEWFIAMANSHLTKGKAPKGPYWIRQRWKWGPSEWPLYWCQLIELNTLDCGALRLLAQKAFELQEVAVFPVQLVQQFSPQDTQQWRQQWQCCGHSSDWILEDLAYHEACAVLRWDNHIEIWDPSENCWISPVSQGYGGVVAIRVNVEKQENCKTLFWGRLGIQANVWTVVEL